MPPLKTSRALFLASLTLLGVISASASADTRFRLAYDGPATVPTGRPVRLELRADLDRRLTAVAFEVRSTGAAAATLTARSGDPRAENGMVYASLVRQNAPFESDLPQDLSSAPAREVLLHFGDPPFDSIPTGEDALVGWVEVTPTSDGPLTVALANLSAASTEWQPDGALLDPAGIDPAHTTVTLTAERAFVADVDADGDVDMRDFAALQICFSGADVAPTDPACADTFDADEDGDVDGDELSMFTSVFSGPASAAAGAGAPGGFGGALAGAGAGVFPEAAADVDGSSTVDPADLVLVRQRLGLDAAAPENAAADVNADGAIDLLDLIYVRNRIGDSRFNRSFGPDLRITELDFTTTSGAPWVELTHVGSGVLDIRPFYLANEKGGFSYIFSNLPSTFRDVRPGFRLVIAFDGPSPPTWIGGQAAPTGVIFHVGAPFQLPDPVEDACRLLVQDGQGGGWVSQRVAWGGPEQTEAVVDPALTPLPEGGSLATDPYEPDLWRVVRSSTPGRPNELAPPAPYFPYEGLALEPSDPPRLVWTDVRYGSLRYRVQVSGDGGFASTLVDRTVEGVALDIDEALDAGEYSWRVRVESGAWESAWSDTARFTVLPEAGDGGGAGNALGTVSIDWFRQNPLPPPDKDTSLLCLECEQSSGAHAWDAAHSKAQHTCPHGKAYGPLSVVAAINHYYGGSARLDLLSLRLAKIGGGTSSFVTPIGHGTAVAQTRETQTALVLLALGLDADGSRNVPIATGSQGSIDRTLRDGYPILAWRSDDGGGCGSAPVLVFGYSPVSPSRPERVLVLDPHLGNRAGVNIVAEVPLTSLCSAVTLTLPRKHFLVNPIEEDASLRRDTDGDGINDYDEIHRLATTYDDADFDRDGLGDKLEIFSYRFGRGRVKRKPDVDGDGLRAEVDEDGDNDGCPDGEEDRNRNGHYLMTLGASLLQQERWTDSQIGPANRERGESDPFFADIYQLVLTPGRQKVAIGRTVPLEVELRYVDQGQEMHLKEDATIELMIADDQYRGDLADAGVTTDEKGHAETTFTPAGEIRGDVEIKAIYKPCDNSVKQWEASVVLEVVEVDWMFTIQNEAVLTQTEVLRLNPTRTFDGRVSRVDWRAKDPGYQRLEGYFTHPDHEHAGKYIDRITVSPSLTGTMKLWVNDELAPNLVWQRADEDEDTEPMTWRLEVADPDVIPDGGNGIRLPDRLIVTGEGFTVSTPLVSWSACGTQSDQVRDYTTGHIVLSRDYRSRYASAYFGDGDVAGYDTGPGRENWPESEHTSVSFIPRGSVDGNPAGYLAEGDWWPLRWTDTRGGGTAFISDIFGLGKNDVRITDPFPWTVSDRSSADLDALIAALFEEIETGGRITPPPLIGELVFERDYLPAELEQLEQRGLEPPRHLITLSDR